MTRRTSRLVLLAAVALAAVVIATHSPARVSEPAEPFVPDLVADGPPARYEAWPPFVLEWLVEGSSGAAGSAFDSAFGRDPCGPLGVERCHVRLAWQDVSRWSLAASTGRGPTGGEALQVSTGGLHYAVDRGVVVGVVDTDRLPGLHVCHRLAEARSSGMAVTAKRAGGLAGDAWALGIAGLGAECTGPAGIPVRLETETATWVPTSLSQRVPTPAEIGDAWVAGSAEVCPEVPCGDPAAEAHLAALARAALFEATPTGAGVEVVVPWARRGRQIFAWATDPAASLPPGMRRHRIAPDFVVDESLRPLPAVSAVVGGSRLWLGFDAAAPPGGEERDVFVLGEALRRIAAESPRAGGSLPVTPAAVTR